MPMPRLLKKFSDKNFRRRTKSMSSSSGIDSPQLESPPPLPVPRSAAASETSFGAELALRAPLNGTSSYIYDKPTPPTPKSAASSPGIYSIPGAVALNGTLYPPPVPPPAHGPVVVAKAANGPVQTISGYTNGGLPSGTTPPPPQDELSLDLQAAWKTATTDPKQSKADKLLQKIEDGGVAAMAKQSQGAAMVEGIKTGLEMVGGMEAIEKGLNAVKDGMPVLMSALDEVAKLHPFVGVAVMAFKAVWALEMKRRENDRKILLLHSEMKDMMSVLIQLKSVKDPNEIAPDGSTIQGRMEVIVETAAKDIKACGNACDTYVKKKLVVKVIKGVIWESKLAAFSGAFAKRKEEFEFALSIHTALGVDAANRGINTVDERTQAMNAKIDMMMKMFAQMMSPQEREMSRLVAQKGTSVLDNDKALKELCEYENRIVESQSGSGPVHGAKTAKATDFADLKNELHTDPDIAMNENARTYDRKFEVQRRQIVDELTKVVEREGDRVISSILSGPHDKIVDPNVHAVWKEMGWRGSVKARHFVMGIRDHFQDHNHPHPASPARAQTKEERAEAADPLPALDKEDEWALEYIDVVNLQAISEAFDDDASGFVTTAEVNAFTAGRPLDWSLPRWIAYWAIGAHQTAMSYHTKIHDILGKMFAIRPRLLPANKSGVDRYLEAIYRGVYTVVGSLNACYAPDGLQQRFAAYVTAEEERLRGNLEAIRYDIDAFETLELVTGEGRIDRYVLPLFYLFLEHHLKLLRACQDHVLHPEELWDAADTLEYVSDAVSVRVEMLRTIFKQQKLDVAQQFKGFSFGMYEYSNEPNLLWAAENVQKFNFREYTFDESDEPKYDVAKILNYPYDQEPLDFAAYALPKAIKADEPPAEILPAMAGLFSAPWSGFMYWPATLRLPTVGMLTVELKSAGVVNSKQLFKASARANVADFTIDGECQEVNGVMQVSWRRAFPTHFSAQYWDGTWNPETNSITGTLGMDELTTSHPASFVFRQMPPEIVCFVPSPLDLVDNKCRALWAFAIGAVLNEVRRKRYSWSFFKERRDNRVRFVELYIRGGGDRCFGRPLTDDERLELWKLKKSMTTADSRFMHSIAEARIRATTDHNAHCDSCGGSLGGARITCLVCQMAVGAEFNTVDFDDNPECLAQRVMRDDMEKPHLPHHDLMKVQRVVHEREFGKIMRNAQEALKNARMILANTQQVVETLSPVSGPSKRVSMLPSATTAKLTISIPDAPSHTGYPLSAVSELPAAAGPRCSQCERAVTQPCWYCVQCDDESFICMDCDAKGEVKFGKHDWRSHDLVRVAEVVEEHDRTMEERLEEMEEQFTKHQQQMDERLEKLEARVDARMDKVELLLQQVLGKLQTR